MTIYKHNIRPAIVAKCNTRISSCVAWVVYIHRKKSDFSGILRNDIKCPPITVEDKTRRLWNIGRARELETCRARDFLVHPT